MVGAGLADAGRLTMRKNHLASGLRPEHCVFAMASFEIKQQTRSNGKAQIVLEECTSNDVCDSEEPPLPELCRQRKELDATIQRKREEKRLEAEQPPTFSRSFTISSKYVL